MDQRTVFFQGEGDAWFTRNRSRLAREAGWDTDLVLQLIARRQMTPTAVLEVGAANGYRLAAMVQRFGCSATAVEASGLAIEDGQARFPDVRFVRGQAHELSDLADGSFDLVIVNFVLHWVDRCVLLHCVAEIDRVLRDGGWVVVGDFAPERPERVKYHHLPEGNVWTYKQDYPAIWLASGLYEEVTSLAFHHGTLEIGDGVEPAHRGRVSLLRKTLQGRYRVSKLP